MMRVRPISALLVTRAVAACAAPAAARQRLTPRGYVTYGSTVFSSTDSFETISNAGAGISFIKYEEHAAFAESGDDVSESKSGAMMLAGADVRIWRWLHAGGEFRFRAVKGVLGDGGVSEVYGDDQLGGYAFALRVSVGR